MKLLAAATVAFALLSPMAAKAQTNPVVIELFTSQGCSSCPPADALMVELAERDDVIPLALHVDYWDYIGWKDRFADPAYTKRQKGYAHMGGRRMVYTPQMIVNGVHDVVGARAMELADLIVEHKGVRDRARVQSSMQGNTARIRIEPLPSLPDGIMDVHLVRYTVEQSVKITKGENAGRTIRYVNTVDAWDVLAEWDGDAPVEVQTTVSGERPAVVLVQHRGKNGPGPIVAAARLQ